MICKYCKNTIPDGSIFCNLCGKQQIRARKKKTEVNVPKPTQRKDGSFYGRIMVDGIRHPVEANSEAEYYARARAVKSGLLEDRKNNRCTLGQALDDYIASVSFLPPSTLRGYDIIRRCRCQDYMEKDIWTIDWQKLIDTEAKSKAPKTVRNTWGLIKLAIDAKGVEYRRVVLPTPVQKEEDFLDYKQIKVFLKAIKGTRSELPALLALHSLRQSELLPLTAESIKDGKILVRGATVLDKNNKYIFKAGNKNSTSRRDVPIMIPRLRELLPEDGPLITATPIMIHKDIKAVCIAAGLPPVSLHDLRRSFASLAFHLGWSEETTMRVGGWSDMRVVHAVYQKLAEDDVNADIKTMQAYYEE